MHRLQVFLKNTVIFKSRIVEDIFNIRMKLHNLKYFIEDIRKLIKCFGPNVESPYNIDDSSDLVKYPILTTPHTFG